MFGVILKTTLKSLTVCADKAEDLNKFNVLKIEKLIEKQIRDKHDYSSRT